MENKLTRRESRETAFLTAFAATFEPEVRLVWEPPWNPSMMDEATKQHFGWTPE